MIKYIAAIIALVSGICGVYYLGYNQSEFKHASIEQALKSKIALLEEKSNQVTFKVDTEYVDKIKYVTQIKEKVVTQYVPQYITASQNLACIVPASFVWLHNAAAKGDVPTGTPPADDAASGVDLIDTTKVVTSNYYSCNQIRQQLISLQQWVTQQSNLYDSTQ